MFDIPGQIRKAITGFLVWMAKTGLKPVMETLGSTVLSTPDLTGNPQVNAVWTTTLVAANGIYVLFIVAGGFVVVSRESLQTQYGFQQIASRLVLGAVISNVSLILCGKAIEFTNALTTAVAGQGVDGPAAAQAIVDMIAQPLSATSPNILFAVLVIAMVVLALVVVVTFLLRVAIMVVLIGLAPLALACHATPQTEGLAYTWWRAFAACLGLQVAQALIVLTAVKVFLTPAGLTLLGVPATKDGLVGVLVCVTMLWLLIKLPGLLKQFVLAPLGLPGEGRGLFRQLVQAYMTVKTLGAVSGLSKGKRAVVAGVTGRPAGGGTRTTSAARLVRGAGGQPMAPRPALSQPSRAAVAFSYAPAKPAPLSARAGRTGAPAFSHSAPPATPAPAPAGPAPAARFSQPAAASPGQSRPANRPAPAAFSNASPASASPPPAGPRPAATFSNPPAAQSAPRRPSAPFTPVFSSAPTTPAARPTAARRPTAAPRRTSAANPPAASPRPAPSPSPTPRPVPATRPSPPPPSPPPPSPPRPAGSTTPVFRPASSPPSPRPSPPPARRQPKGGNP
ncbi:hypothetical protein [Krasilnikovia sp. MM14-A1259]|uniref:hypothetical protein n=1 Tax=Krasilnikovia sp. MM14-A1259 TaxID=3373539 RepID=UPI00399D5509